MVAAMTTIKVILWTLTTGARMVILLLLVLAIVNLRILLVKIATRRNNI